MAMKTKALGPLLLLALAGCGRAQVTQAGAEGAEPWGQRSSPRCCRCSTPTSPTGSRPTGSAWTTPTGTAWAWEPPA